MAPVLKGRGFSRADKPCQSVAALAAEGRFRKPLMLANPKNSPQQQNHQHTQRNPPIPPVLLAEKQEAGDHHTHHRSENHQQHASEFNIQRDASAYEQATKKPGEHDAEASDSSDAKDQSDRPIELRLSE